MDKTDLTVRPSIFSAVKSGTLTPPPHPYPLTKKSVRLSTRGEQRLELGVHRLWNYVDLFWNSLDNEPSSFVFYLFGNESGSGSSGTRH